VNSKQRELLAKYLYDVSKGALLTSVAGILTEKLTWYGLIAAVLVAFYAFTAAYDLEEA
jgi:hypothetical protein